MGRKFHAMHGRDHVAGGSDPIPGLSSGGSALPAIYLYRRRGVNTQSIASGGAGITLEFRQARTNDPSHTVFQPVQSYSDPQGFPAWPSSETAWSGNNSVCKAIRIREPGLYSATLTIRTEGQIPLSSGIFVTNYYETGVPNVLQYAQMSLDTADDYWDGAPAFHFIAGQEDVSVPGSEKNMYVECELSNNSGAPITLQGHLVLAIVQIAGGTDFGSDIAI